MKNYLSVLIILYLFTFPIESSFADTDESNKAPAYSCFQQEPFYFIKEVPVSIKLFGGVNLSFFRNRQVVFMYRYRLQIPDAGTTTVERSLLVWSPWLKLDYSEIRIPRLDLEGGHKFIIEYKELESDVTKMVEMPFFVYRLNLSAGFANVVEPQTSTAERKRTDLRTVPDRAPPDNTAVSKTASDEPAGEPATTDADSLITPGENITVDERDTPVVEKLTFEKIKINLIPSDTVEENIRPAMLLAEYSEDAVIIDDEKEKKTGSEDEIIIQPSRTDPLDSFIATSTETTTFPLHAAVITGENQYAVNLINQGVDLNTRNSMNLSPLHLAALSNNKETAKALIAAGADVNIQGDMGYTPLHIASELNYAEMAAHLLAGGADHRIRTDQGLSSREIAKIQHNNEVVKLFGNKNQPALNQPDQNFTGNMILNNLNIQDPDFIFNLPYDSRLAKQRQFCRVLQIISVPVFAVSAVSNRYLKSEADRYYSLSKIAGTEELARTYYNNTKKYDTYSYLAGGISLTSVFGIVYSTLKKKSVTGRMRKIFY